MNNIMNNDILDKLVKKEANVQNDVKQATFDDSIKDLIDRGIPFLANKELGQIEIYGPYADPLSVLYECKTKEQEQSRFNKGVLIVISGLIISVISILIERL